MRGQPSAAVSSVLMTMGSGGVAVGEGVGDDVAVGTAVFVGSGVLVGGTAVSVAVGAGISVAWLGVSVGAGSVTSEMVSGSVEVQATMDSNMRISTKSFFTAIYSFSSLGLNCGIMLKVFPL